MAISGYGIGKVRGRMVERCSDRNIPRYISIHGYDCGCDRLEM